MGKIKTNLKRIHIDCTFERTDKSMFFSVSNVSPEENNLIINSLMEFLAPIENPRYLFIRKGELLSWRTTDYHAIPSVIGQRKENINTFKLLWEKHIGNCDIVYTRSIEGRKLLLKASPAILLLPCPQPDSPQADPYR